MSRTASRRSDGHTRSRLLADAPASGSAPDEDIDVVVSCVNADAFAHYVTTQEARLAGRYRIGHWWWELEEFPPAAMSAFEHVDEVWCSIRVRR